MKTITICNNCRALNRIPLQNPEGKAPICGSCKREFNFQNGVSEVNGEALEDLIQKSPLPVIVDFWASWCGPCRIFAPTFASAARELGGNFVFAKVNTETYPQASGKYQIRGIPALLAFRNGCEIGRQAGALPLADFTAWVKSI